MKAAVFPKQQDEEKELLHQTDCLLANVIDRIGRDKSDEVEEENGQGEVDCVDGSFNALAEVPSSHEFTDGDERADLADSDDGAREALESAGGRRGGRAGVVATARASRGN